MKVPTVIGGTALGPRLTAVGYGALILLGIAGLSACNGGSGSSLPTESSFTIISSLSSSGSGSPFSGAGGSSPASGDTSPNSVTTTVTVTPTQTTTVTVGPSPAPTQAPVTGGGGTAGFQDGLLLAVGASAIAAGAGGIAYRRRLNRRR